MIFVLFSPVLRPYMWNEKKFSTSCPGNTPTNVCPNDFKILKKVNKVWKSWGLSVPRYIICGGGGKKLSSFRNCFTYDAYKRKHLRRRLREFRKMQLGLEWKWRSNLSSTSKVFLLFTYDMWYYMLKFSIFLYLFAIFN